MNLYEKLSEERKKLQEEGLIPEWYTTAGWQMFKSKYLYGTDKAVRGQFERIAGTAAKHLAHIGKEEEAYEKFFELMWKGWLSLSTPVMSNMGTDRGMPVSCAGSYTGDSVDQFYKVRHETAILTKNGFGTASYLGDIRARGTPISKGGKASGVVPVYKGFVQDSRDVSQGNCYHPDVEILTEHGWMTFKAASELNVKVYQVGVDNSIDLTSAEWVEKDFQGNLIRFFDSKNIDIMVTPNHRMYARNRRRTSNKRNANGKHASNHKVIDIDNFVVCEAKDLKLHRDKFLSHALVSKKGRDALTNDERFLIAFQADGTIIKSSAGPCGTAFHFAKDRKIERLAMILSDCGYDYTKKIQKGGTTRFYIAGARQEKTFSWVNVEDYSTSGAKAFLEEVSHWDGSIAKNDSGQLSFSYTTTIKENSDVLQALAVIAGFKCKTTHVIREGNRQPQYKLFFSEGADFGGESVSKEEVNYDGKVYCAIVPKGGLVVRSNGHTLICGNTRRGAWAGYLPIDHGDFDELADYIFNEIDDCNIGWNISQDFIERLNKGDSEAIRRFQKMMKLKLVTGRGYMCFIDKINKRRPQMYKDKNLDVKAMQLCAEIVLHSSEKYTYTCVLSSMNLSKYNEWKDTDAVFWATVFLDCVAEEFIQKASSPDFNEDERATLKRAVDFTKAGRALGLGAAGFHTYLQQEMIPFESLEAHLKNIEIFKHINAQSKEASQWMAKELGEPEWCVGYGVRNTHRLSVAPTKSSSSLMGGISEGISPDPAMTFTQTGAAGEVDRIVGPLLKIMKERGVYNDETIQNMTDKQGSVQHVDWLTPEEKEVFKTAFEINQKAVIRLASARADYLDQWQSLNLFFGADEDPAWISEVHQEAFMDPKILGLYYIYTQAGVQGSKGECLACQ